MVSLPRIFARKTCLRLAVTGAIAVIGAVAAAVAIAIAGPAPAVPAPAVPVADPIDVGSQATATPASTWDRLAQCESSGNWAADTGNGFSGGLQFTASTWRAYGGQGAAHTASRTEQIQIAERVRADQGWDAWPACSAKLGLS
jgi:resuscitation-promoting factor RpfA